MKSFKYYESVEEWWNNLSFDEKKLACDAAHISYNACVDSWSNLSLGECDNLVKLWLRLVN